MTVAAEVSGPPTTDMRRLFEPRTVAVVGVSRRPGHPSRKIVRNLLQTKTLESLYVVGSRLEEFPEQAPTHMRTRVLTSTDELPDGLDVVVSLLPSGTPDLVAKCVERHAGFVVIESETRAEDSAIADLDLKGTRVVGPNCIGVINGRHRLSTSFSDIRRIDPGNVSFVSQTGIIAGGLLQEALERYILDVSHVASIGDMADIWHADVLHYLATDPTTDVVGIYLESEVPGRRLIAAIGAVRADDTPVVALLGGSSTAGARVAESHTGRLAGGGELMRGALRQAGVHLVDEFSTWMHVCAAFGRWPHRPSARRVLVITTSGATGVVAADLCDAEGLRLADIDSGLTMRLAQAFGDRLKPVNPLDIEVAAETQDLGEVTERILQLIEDEESIDAVLVLVGLFKDDLSPRWAHLAATRKPCVVWAYGRIGPRAELDRLLHASGALRTVTMTQAVQVLGHVTREHDGRRTGADVVSGQGQGTSE